MKTERTLRWILCLLLSSLLILPGTVFANSQETDLEALWEAETLDEQLAILDKIAAEHAAELENGDWENSYARGLAPGFPADMLPDDWEELEFKEAEGLPEELRGHKMLAVLWPDEMIAGDLMVRFLPEMRAASLAEAEYALIIRYQYVPSGYQYIPPASSSHCDYEAYIVDLKTAEFTRFWKQRNYAKHSGKWGQLNGDRLSQKELWTILRSQFLPELRYTQADGTVLLFALTGENCYLKGFEGEPTELDLPAEVEGHRVTEIAENCFLNVQSLRTIRLSEGLCRISASAFQGCAALESVEFPDTLESIGDSAFEGCLLLEDLKFPDKLHRIGSYAFSAANAIRTLSLPGSLREIGESAFAYCKNLASVTVEEGISKLPQNIFSSCRKLSCCYLPGSLTGGAAEAELDPHVVIYAPEGSAALKWAEENDFESEACGSVEDMPGAEYRRAGDFEFLIFREEAALSAYLGSEANVMIPDKADGLPVTRILSGAAYNLDFLESLTLPQSIRLVNRAAIFAPNKNEAFHLYVSGAETSFEKGSLGRYGGNGAPFTIHAPEGSQAQRYVTEEEQFAFEPWGEGIDPDLRSVSDALLLAEKIQQSVIEFWATCDQSEYAWLKRLPDYDIQAPEAVGVLRLTREQFDDLALLMGSREEIATAFATTVNTQWNLPYAKAAARTAQNGKFDPVADGSCTFVVLAYRSDIVLAALREDGSAQAALLCSSPKIIEQISPEYIKKIAKKFGVTEAECNVYTGEAALALTKN